MALISDMIRSCEVLCRVVAEQLAVAEEKLAFDSSGSVPPSSFSTVFPSIQSPVIDIAIADRCRKSAESALLQTVRKGRARRPDVLSVVSSAISSPEHPDTSHVANYAVILALRVIYGIEYSAPSLQSLRDAHHRLGRSLKEDKKRRERKQSSLHERFLIDVLCFEGSLYRSFSRRNLRAYYGAFASHPFGIDRPSLKRQFSDSGEWPELHGDMPDFASLLTLCFAQPTGVPGLDDITGGLLSALPNREYGSSTGGMVTLIAGPAGSGKTSICLTLASRQAELGASVRYVATEESIESLDAKRIAITAPMRATAWLPYAAETSENFQFVDGTGGTLESLLDELRLARRTESNEEPPGRLGYLTLAHIVVIDSLAGLGGIGDGSAKARLSLARILSELRDLSVCVVLVGGQRDCDDNGIGYLVDNVFRVEFEEEDTKRHPIRVFCVEKTRLQVSDRGRHVLHLSREDGCHISPSLHSVLRSVSRQVFPLGSSGSNRAVLWAPRTKQMSLPGLAEVGVSAVTVRTFAQVLVFGHGSSGKSRLALSWAFEPRVATHPASEWASYVATWSERNRRLLPSEADVLTRTRVLVVSFTYGRAYYENIAADVFKVRFGILVGDGDDLQPGDRLVRKYMTVLRLHPGYTDPETLVARVRATLVAGRANGRPFTCVVMDGVHNLVLQFPLLAREPLLWPTLYRLFRVEAVACISVFTFFGTPHARDRKVSVDFPGQNLTTPLGADYLFHHMLVNSSDSSFFVEPDPAGDANKKERLLVHWISSVDSRSRQPRTFVWDTSTLGPPVKNDAPAGQHTMLGGSARDAHDPLVGILAHSLDPDSESELVG